MFSGSVPLVVALWYKFVYSWLFYPPNKRNNGKTVNIVSLLKWKSVLVRRAVSADKCTLLWVVENGGFPLTKPLAVNTRLHNCAAMRFICVVNDMCRHHARKSTCCMGFSRTGQSPAVPGTQTTTLTHSLSTRLLWCAIASLSRRFLSMCLTSMHTYSRSLWPSSMVWGVKQCCNPSVCLSVPCS